jgi:hypothetical protein
LTGPLLVNLAPMEAEPVRVSAIINTFNML